MIQQVFRQFYLTLNKKLLMSRLETVYALSSKGYFHTSRPQNHPSIVRANERNVHLDFVRCHQVFKGESQFKDPKQEQAFKSSRSLPAKGNMFKSEITEASTHYNEQSSRNHPYLTPNIVQRKRTRTLVSRSVHLGSSIHRVQKNSDNQSCQQKNQKRIYDFQQTTKLKIPNNLQEFISYKSEALINEGGNSHLLRTNQSQLKNQGHKQHVLLSLGQPKIISNLQQAARLEHSMHQDSSQSTKKLKTCTNMSDSRISMKSMCNNVEVETPTKKRNESQHHYYSASVIGETPMTIKFNKIAEKRSIDDHSKQKLNCQSQASQLNKLRLELAKKQRELKQCKQIIQNGQKKTKFLQIQLKKLQTNNQMGTQNKYSLVSYPSFNTYSSQKNSNQLSKELGGSPQAFLFLTLFMVLLSKDMVGI